VSVLLPEYKDNPRPGFVPGIQDLEQRYCSLRRIRGDGNCFYRGFLFGLMEKLLEIHALDAARAEATRERVANCLRQSKNDLISVGYDELAIDEFWESTVEAFDTLFSKTLETLELMFREEYGEAEYMVWYCRALVAGHMKKNPDRFLPFIVSIDDATGTAIVDINDFCRRQVEPMGCECESVQVIALCEALEIPVRIEYLDGSELENGQVSKHTIPEDAEEVTVTLLYRPGHYDLLYLPP